jgi:hypothetical protein
MWPIEKIKVMNKAVKSAFYIITFEGQNVTPHRVMVDIEEHPDVDAYLSSWVKDNLGEGVVWRPLPKLLEWRNW